MGSEGFAAQVAGVATLADPVRRRAVPVRGRPAGAGHPGPGLRGGRRAPAHREVPPGPAGRRGPARHRLQAPVGAWRAGRRAPDQAVPPLRPAGHRRDTRTQVRPRRPAHGAPPSTSPPAERTPVLDALHRAAADQGTLIGGQARQRAGPRPTHEQRVAAACATLADYGYEPRRTEHAVVLANCPFHALAQEHTDLVCGMNLALIDAAAHPARRRQPCTQSSNPRPAAAASSIATDKP